MKTFILEYIGNRSDITESSAEVTNIYPAAYRSLESALSYVIDDSLFTDKIIISCVYSDVLSRVKPVARMASYKGV